VDNDVDSFSKTSLSRITAIYFGPTLKFYASSNLINIMILEPHAQCWRDFPGAAREMPHQLWINTVVELQTQAGSGIPGDEEGADELSRTRRR
jgi:hypothetical protein